MNFIYRFFSLILLLELGFASLPDADEQENAAYLQGISLRNQAQELLKSPAGKAGALVYLGDAISIFKPLAEKNDSRPGFAKAQHNLAHCHFLMRDFPASLNFFRLAKDQGLEASARNLGKFPFVLTMPDELLIHTATFLDIKSLLNLMQSSKQLYRDCHMALPLMNFLTADGKVLLPGFESVIFNHAPKSVQVRRQVKTKGNVELHFKDLNHLKEIGGRFPYVKSKRTHFVFDPEANHANEIQSDGALESSLVIHVIADQPLQMTGRLRTKFSIVLPTKSDAFGFSYKGSGIFTNGPILPTQSDAEMLAVTFQLLSDEAVALKTAQAKQMLDTRRAYRAQNPQLYPEFSELAPRPGIYSPTHPIAINPRDDLQANSLFYIAASQAEIDNVTAELPGKFSDKIFLVHPNLRGVYFSGDLKVERGFEISTEGDFFMVGRIELPDYNLKIFSERSACFFGSSIVVQSLHREAKTVLAGPGPLPPQGRPNGISRENWVAFCEFCKSLFQW